MRRTYYICEIVDHDGKTLHWRLAGTEPAMLYHAEEMVWRAARAQALLDRPIAHDCRRWALSLTKRHVPASKVLGHVTIKLFPARMSVPEAKNLRATLNYSL